MEGRNDFNLTFAIMKGIAIVSVVIGHCISVDYVEDFVNQYHLAVFFFVAGYFFKEKYLENWRLYIVKKFKSLYFPFVQLCLIFLLLHNVFYKIHLYESNLTISEIISGGAKIFFCMASFEPLMGAMWFCPALFWVSLISFLFLRLSKENTVRGAIFLLGLIIGGICCHFQIKSPYCLWQYLQVCVIFFMGNVFRGIEPIISGKKLNICMSILAFMIIGFSTYYGILGHLQPNNINIENPFVISMIGLIGSLGVYGVSSLLADTFLGCGLSILGNYSFVIMAFHFLAFKVVAFMQCLFLDLDVSNLATFPCLITDNGWWILYVVAGVVLPVFLSKTYHKLMFNLSLVK